MQKATITETRYGIDEMARWALFGCRWSLGHDIGVQWRFAGTRCWGVGDDDHRDVISNKREDLQKVVSQRYLHN